MLLVTGIATIALAFWARWLGRRHGTPGFVRHLGWAFGVAWLIGGLATGWLVRTFGGASQGVDASQRQRLLAEGISEAMNALAFSAGLLILGAIAMLFLTWRYHWGKKPSGPTGTPPYR